VARAYRGVLDKFVSVDEKGAFKLDKVSRVASLGSNPSDGTLDFYASGPKTRACEARSCSCDERSACPEAAEPCSAAAK
jgi:hypothetical protein